jgi:hypothetical protein
MKELSVFLQQAKSDSLNVSPQTDSDRAPWTLPDQAPQQSPQLRRLHKLMDATKETLPKAGNYRQPEAFEPSPTHDLITELVQFPPTLENTTDLMWQQIKANAIAGISESLFEPINMPISQPLSGFINAPISAPASEQMLGQSAMSLDEPPYPAPSPQTSTPSGWLNPPLQEAEHGLANDWIQDGPSPSAPWLESAPLPPPPRQTDLGLRLSPIVPPQTLPRRAIALDAWSIAPSEPSLLDLDQLLEALQQEINQDYDRFYGS